MEQPRLSLQIQSEGLSRTSKILQIRSRITDVTTSILKEQRSWITWGHNDGYVMNWHKDEDRIALVKHIYSGCLPDSDDECESCCAKEWCMKNKEDSND